MSNKPWATPEPPVNAFIPPPGFIEPMKGRALPDDRTQHEWIEHYSKLSGWVLEEKYDGHRLIVRINEKRHGIAWAASGLLRSLPPHLHNHLQLLAPGTYDGELYIPGKTSTDVTALKLQHKLKIVLFDILEVYDAGVYRSSMHMTFSNRRMLLERATSNLREGHKLLDVAITDQSVVSPDALDAIWARGGEGAMIKNVLSTYQPGKRIDGWLKFKRTLATETRIVGYESGRLGPYSRVKAVDKSGVVVSVKTLNDDWRRRFKTNPEHYIGKTLVISYLPLANDRTAKGKYRSPMFDHILEA